MDLFHRRQGEMDYHQIYFYTATIIQWKPLLVSTDMKNIIVNSLQVLCQRKLIALYGFVIMPNHIHLLWELKKRNGKESPANSFMKFTAHEFKKQLTSSDIGLLKYYASSKKDRSYEFWKRDPLAIPITSEEAFIQKLEYIHNNPVSAKWNLCQYPEDYHWSSAAFYLRGINSFDFLTHFREA